MIPPNQYNEITTYLSTLASPQWIEEALRSAIPDLEQASAERYLAVSRTTAYSTSYIGQLKPSGRVRAALGGDPGYALDQLRLFSDLTSPEIDKNAISFGSDLAYAAAQEKLLSDKAASSQAEFNSFFDDAGYADTILMAIGDKFTDG
ncbi:hypothetical protein D0962_04310 [Leptolyngbyaceae cyanobacterium CCMR0082]|uniref:Uncharacterized protein n=1 Tax=Adonisia turfae CCMR0082 TaxID=2304604 RepID=A0A6M0S0M0_9CYAN|nr:hypothetical protein [Adonisia turfae]NEZ62004.1 hypothetical protein [Adonisia turfae CCMR0082]